MMVLSGGNKTDNSSKLVIFFHPYFSDGGVERTNIYQAKGLLERGYKVEFLTTQAADHYLQEVNEVGIRLVELGSARTLLTTGKVSRYLSAVSKQYDCVYFISCQYYVNVISMFVALMLWKWRNNIRFINSERNHFQEFSVNGGLKNYLIFLLVRHLYRFADVVIANSEETAEDLGKVIGRSVQCVYNPTINERIDSLRGEEINELWFIDDARPCIIAIGRFTRQKDFATLLHAFRIVRNSIDAKLVILGDGELKEEIESLVRKMGLLPDVYLPGFVGNPYKFLAASSVFVLSSRYEGLPNVLIEAVYLGIPCVSTACKSGPREILFNGEGGYLVPVGDECRMAEAILTSLADPLLSRAMAEIAYSGTQRFRYQKVKDDFEKVINL